MIALRGWTLLCILMLSGCIHFHRKKGTSYEEGIPASERQSRRELEKQRDTLRDFDRFDSRLDSSKKRKAEIDIYHDRW